MNSFTTQRLVSFPRTLLLTLLLAAVVMVALIAASSSGWQVHGLTGHSMEPTITPGSVLISKAVPTDALQIGDVVLFEVGWLGPAAHVTAAHRITRIVPGNGGTLVYTRGDGNQVDDPAPTLLAGKAIRASLAIGYGEQMLQVARIAGLMAAAAFLYLAAMRSASILLASPRCQHPVAIPNK